MRRWSVAVEHGCRVQAACSRGGSRRIETAGTHCASREGLSTRPPTPMRNQNTSTTRSRSPLRIVVTGAAGFIGSNLIERHLRMGDRVVGCDDFSTGSRANLASFADDARFRFIEGDVRSSDALVRAIAESDIVYHL